MRLRSALFPLIIVSLVLTGCGGGAKKNGSTTTTTPGQTPTTVDPALVSADRSYGQQVVLVQSDLPDGWIASAPQSDNLAATETADLLNQCVGLPKNDEIRVMKISGNDFKNGDNSVSSDVTSLKTAKLVQQDHQGVTNAKNFPCIANVLDAELSGMVDGGGTSSTVAKLPGVATGDNQFALRVTTIATINGGVTNVYSDILGMAVGRYEASINVTYFEAPAPTDFDKALLGALARHMAAVKS